MEKENTQDWTLVLPRGTAGKIEELLLENFNNGLIPKKISERTILRILKGESEDTHGILALAAEMSKERIKSNEKLMQDYSFLKLKRSQPLTSI